METEPFISPLDTEGISQGVQNSVVSRVGNRVRKQTQRMRESREQELLKLSTYYECMNERDYESQESMDNPIVFKPSTDPDVLYYYQVMATDDSDQFIEAMLREIDGYYELRVWELIPREQVTEGYHILDSVWAMKRKRDIKTREVFKWKSRLNIHGGQQELGEDYFETYSPVVTSAATRILLILSILLSWTTKQIDFVMTYPQADIEFDMYIQLPHGMITKYGSSTTRVLFLWKNLYE